MKKHSEFIGFGIELYVEKSKEKEVTDSKQAEDEKEVEEEVGAEKEKEAKKKKTKVKEVLHEWEQLNKNKFLWMRKSEEVTSAEYASFYKSLSNDWEDNLSVKHSSVEGQLDFRALPSTCLRPRKKGTTSSGTSTHSRVNFAKSVVNSKDLPLNISRDTLQQNKVLRVIKKNLVKKCLDMFAEMSRRTMTTRSSTNSLASA